MVMKHMGSCRLVALRQAGYKGAFPDMWTEHLRRETSNWPPKARMDMERQILEVYGVTGKDLGAMWFEWLGDMGYSHLGTLADRWRAYWCDVANGEPGAPGLPAAWLLNAKFDSYIGILDQTLSDGAVLGPAQGVSGGVLVATVGAGWVHTISGNQYHMAAAAASSNRLMSQDAVPFTKGLWIRSKSSATNTPAVSSFTLAFAASNGSTSGKAQIGSNSTTGKIRLRDSSGLVDTAIDYLANETAEMMIIMGEANTAHYYYRSDGVPTWQYVGVQTAFTTPDDNYLAFTALLSDNSIDMLEVGDDGASILDAKVEALADPDLNSSFWWQSLNDCTLENGELVFPGVVGGYAYHDPADGSGRPDRTLKHNTWYECTFTISEYTGTQGVQIVCGDNQIPRTDRTAVGTYTEILNSGGDGYAGVQSTASDFAGRISYISFKEITAPASAIDNLKGNIVSASFGPAEGPGDLKGPNVITAAIADYDTSGGGSTFDGTHWVVDGTQISFASIGQLGQATVGLTYEMTFEIVEITAGTVSALFGTAIVGSFDTPGVHTIQGEQVGNLGLFMRGDVDFVGKLGVLSVVQVYPNTLVLNDGDELHDDYPANGVGKIRRGSLITRDAGAATAILAGGLAQFQDPLTSLNGFAEINGNTRQAGLSVIGRVVLSNVPQNNVEISFGSNNALNAWETRVIIQVGYNLRIITTNGSDSTIRFNGEFAAGENVELQIVCGGFNAGGEPGDNTDGFVFLLNGEVVFSDSVSTVTNLFASYSDRGNLHYLDSLQTKIDLAALATPQRALFNDTFRPVGEDIAPPINDSNYTGTGQWVIEPGVASVSTDGASSDLKLNGTVFDTSKQYTITVSITTTQGTLLEHTGVAFGAGFTDSGVKEYTFYGSGSVADQILYRTQSNWHGTVSLLQIVEVGAPHLDAYLPENGVPFTTVKGQLKVGSGYVYNVTSGTDESAVCMALIRNPGGYYWEWLGRSVNGLRRNGLCFRYQDNDNYWRAWMRTNVTTEMYIEEIVGGAPTTRAFVDTLLPTSVYYRFVLTDDGENITLICPESGHVISYASTAGAEHDAMGLWLRADAELQSRMEWFAARTGTVEPFYATEKVFQALTTYGGVDVGVGDLVMNNTDTYYVLNPATKIWDEFGAGVPLWMDGWLHYEPAAENLIDESRDLTQWTPAFMDAVDFNQVGMTGEANTACFLDDQEIVETSWVTRTFTIPADTNVYTLRVFVKKDNDQTRFPRFDMWFGGTNTYATVNTATGEVIGSGTGGSGREVNDAGDWWEVLVYHPNDGVDTQAIVYLSPARSAEFNLDNQQEAVGSIIVGQVELYRATLEQVRGTSPIFTAGAPVSVARTDYQFDLNNHSNVKGAWYCEVVLGHDAAGKIDEANGILSMRNSTTLAANLLYLHNIGEKFSTYDGSNLTQGHTSTIFEADTIHKVGVVYDGAAAMANVRTEERFFLETDGVYDGEYLIDAGLIRLFVGGVHAKKMRNLQRYHVDYDRGKQIIDILMQGGTP